MGLFYNDDDDIPIFYHVYTKLMLDHYKIYPVASL
jgi:hypothetical protein